MYEPRGAGKGLEMKRKLQKLIREYKVAMKKADAIDAAWENDYENEELEAAWDAAYKAEHKAMMNLVDALVQFSRGMLTKQAAFSLVRIKFSEVEALVARMA